MNDLGHSSPYDLSNPTVHLATTGDQSRGGQFSDDSSYAYRSGSTIGAARGVTALLLSMVLLASGIYSWLA
jgi:hypothetical protein